MGLLTSAAKKVATSAVKKITKDVATDVAISAAIKVLDASTEALDKADAAIAKKREKKAEKKKEQIITGNTDANRLIVSINGGKKKEYIVRDRNSVVKFTVKEKKKHCLQFYDCVGNEIGLAKEKLLALRAAIFHEENPVDFLLEVRGEKQGILKSKNAFSKQKFELESKQWTIDSAFSGKKYKICEGNKLIAETSSKMRQGNEYAIDIYEDADELLVLMVGLVVDLVSAKD